MRRQQDRTWREARCAGSFWALSSSLWSFVLEVDRYIREQLGDTFVVVAAGHRAQRAGDLDIEEKVMRQIETRSGAGRRDGLLEQARLLRPVDVPGARRIEEQIRLQIVDVVVGQM